MTKPKNENNLPEKILEWLETQGYDTEMKVARILHEEGIKSTTHSLYYEDPETKTSREIDIVVSGSVDFLYAYLVIECKKSQKPWVAFTTNSIGVNKANAFAITSPEGRDALSGNYTELNKIDWFRKGRIAFGITEAFTSKEDISFKAGISATKASIALSQHESFNNDFSYFFPTVVLDGKLFECYLDEQGNSILNEIDSVFLQFEIKFGNKQGSSVHIVTLNSFRKYCKEFKSTFEYLKEILIKERRELAVKEGIKPESID